MCSLTKCPWLLLDLVDAVLAVANILGLEVPPDLALLDDKYTATTA